jgi:hypothetical protein
LDEEILIGNQEIPYDVLAQLKEYRKTKLGKSLTEEGHT